MDTDEELALLEAHRRELRAKLLRFLEEDVITYDLTPEQWEKVPGVIVTIVEESGWVHVSPEDEEL